MFIQICFDMPIHWIVENVELKSMVFKKKHELVELLTVSETDFYEKVCHKTKTISFTSKIETISTNETIHCLNVNTDEEILAFILKNGLKGSKLTSLELNFKLSNEDQIETNDVTITSVHLTDNMLRKVLQINR